MEPKNNQNSANKDQRVQNNGITSGKISDYPDSNLDTNLQSDRIADRQNKKPHGKSVDKATDRPSCRNCDPRNRKPFKLWR